MSTSPVMTVTDELLAELEAITQLATPGPWVARIEQDSPSFQGYYVSNYGFDMYACLGTSNQGEIDSSFIATANPATITALTTELRRLRAENAELGGLLREAGKTIHKLQAEQPTPLRIARYLDAMRAKIDAAMQADQ